MDSKTEALALQEKLNALKAIKRLFTHKKALVGLQGTLTTWMDNKTTVNADYDEEAHNILMAVVEAQRALDRLHTAMSTYELFHQEVCRLHP